MVITWRHNEMQMLTKICKTIDSSHRSIMKILLPKEQIWGRPKQCTAMNAFLQSGY